MEICSWLNLRERWVRGLNIGNFLSFGHGTYEHVSFRFHIYVHVQLYKAKWMYLKTRHFLVRASMTLLLCFIYKIGKVFIATFSCIIFNLRDAFFNLREIVVCILFLVTIVFVAVATGK